ncbi:hypothetical protein EK0264_13440 [Epidermidibacterium keratini]|uniref:Uncharacterized protein n=1 Tax=Epidermidibacterium keratini TaxID=1891644 RepID=A0A7L4YQL3_9ACTN|nr:hypothetical protein [Epidermidibacterium keratini]QHC01194.1 hypothetical protein EK0264_13440 [Epidermidibacterium keratini]
MFDLGQPEQQRDHREELMPHSERAELLPALGQVRPIGRPPLRDTDVLQLHPPSRIDTGPGVLRKLVDHRIGKHALVIRREIAARHPV